MGGLSIWHWLIVLAVVLVLFGGSGKLSRLMGDMAKGVNAFKKGLKEGDSDGAEDPQRQIRAEQTAAPAEAANKDQAAKG